MAFDKLKVYARVWRTGGSANSMVRCNPTGTIFQSLPTSDPGSPNIDFEAPSPDGDIAFPLSLFLFQGHLSGTAGTIHLYVDGVTARFVDGEDAHWYNLAPSLVDAGSPSITAIPSGLRQRDRALKSVPFHVTLSGTSTDDTDWETIDYLQMVIPPFVSGI